MVQLDMNPAEVVDKLSAAILILQNENKELKQLSVNMAESKKQYAIALNKEILRLRTQGIPVTIMLQMAKGDEVVAQKRFEKDIAECSYFCCRDGIDILKAEIDTLRSLLSFMKIEYNTY